MNSERPSGPFKTRLSVTRNAPVEAVIGFDEVVAVDVVPLTETAVQCSGFYGEVGSIIDFSDGGCSLGGESGVTLGSSCGC